MIVVELICEKCKKAYQLPVTEELIQKAGEEHGECPECGGYDQPRNC